jgi:hypothetical protein
VTISKSAPAETNVSIAPVTDDPYSTPTTPTITATAQKHNNNNNNYDYNNNNNGQINNKNNNNNNALIINNNNKKRAREEDNNEHILDMPGCVSKIMRTIQYGTLQDIQNLFNKDKGEKQLDPEMMERNGLTLVHFAAMRQSGDSLEIIKYLVDEMGCPANWCEIEISWNPIFVAIKYKNDSCIQYLLEKECDPNHIDDEEKSALMLAVEYGSSVTGAIETLVSAGADLAFPK